MGPHHPLTILRACLRCGIINASLVAGMAAGTPQQHALRAVRTYHGLHHAQTWAGRATGRVMRLCGDELVSRREQAHSRLYTALYAVCWRLDAALGRQTARRAPSPHNATFWHTCPPARLPAAFTPPCLARTPHTALRAGRSSRTLAAPACVPYLRAFISATFYTLYLLTSPRTVRAAHPLLRAGKIAIRISPCDAVSPARFRAPACLVPICWR